MHTAERALDAAGSSVFSDESPLENIRASVDAAVDSEQRKAAREFQTTRDAMVLATVPVASLILEADAPTLERDGAHELAAHVDALVAYELVAQRLWADAVKNGMTRPGQTESWVRQRLGELHQTVSPHRPFAPGPAAVFESAAVVAEGFLNRAALAKLTQLNGRTGVALYPTLSALGVSPWERFLYAQRFVANVVETHKDRLVRLRADRPDLTRHIDRLVGQIASDRSQAPQTFESRFVHLMDALHSVGLNTRTTDGLISNALEAVTRGDTSINFAGFREQLGKRTLSQQTDAVVLAMDKFGNDEAWGDRKARAASTLSELDTSLGRGSSGCIAQWEKTVARLFRSNPDDKAWYASLSSRDKATLLLLSVQHDFGMQAKVRRLLEMPEATQLVVELGSTAVADRFAGWREAAMMAAMIHRQAGATTDQHISMRRKLTARAARILYPHPAREPGSGDGSPRPPRKPNWGAIGVVGFGLVAVACGAVGLAKDGTLPAPGVSTTNPTVGPTAGPVITGEASAAATAGVTHEAIGAASFLPLDAFQHGLVDGAPLSSIESVGPEHFLTQLSLAVLAGQSDGSPEAIFLQSALQDTPLWAEARIHCVDPASCKTGTAVYAAQGSDGKNEFRIAQFLVASDGFTLAASANADGSLNLENSRWLPPLIAHDGTQLVPYEAFDFGVATQDCRVVPAPFDQRRVVWADPDTGAIVAYQTLFGNGLAELVVTDHGKMFGDDNAFRDICNMAFAARATADGTLVGAYFAVSANGDVTFANGKNADGVPNMTAFRDSASGKWEWLAAGIATPTPEPSATEGEPALVPVVPESMTCARPDRCFHMEPIGPQQMYRDYAEAWVANPAMQTYLRELGVPPTLDGFLAFLPTSFGPDGQPYYLPGKTPQGTPLRFLLGTYVSGLMKENPAASKGVYFDGLRFLFYSLNQWDNNDGGVRDYLQALYRANTKVQDPPTIGGGTLKQYRVSEFGIVITDDQRVMFVGGNEHPGYSLVQNNGLFGGTKGDFRQDIDPRVASAMWRTYLNFMKVAATSEINTPDAYRYTCVDDPSYCTSGITYNNVDASQLVFIPRP